MTGACRAPVLAWAALALALGLAVPGAAHCDDVEEETVPDADQLVCHNGPVEAGLEAAYGAVGRDLVVVYIEDFRFHPEVVTVRSGGTVLFVNVDGLAVAFEHTVRSSGTCGSQEADLDRCPPTVLGACFNSFTDLDVRFGAPGMSYPLTMRYDNGTGTVQKSFGFRTGTPVGDATAAQPFVNCPEGSSSNSPERAVIPYHCEFHGMFNPLSGVDMRGAIVVVP